jgi:high-affinity Fe2+/Pb2+ permease
MATSNDKTHQTVIAMFNQSYEEITYYRTLEWKIVSSTIAVLVGVAFLASAKKEVPSAQKAFVQVVLVLFTAGVAAYGCWHIHKVHWRLTWNRNLRIRCEKSLGLFDDPGSKASERLLEKAKSEEATYWLGFEHLVCWWILIVLTAIYALYSIMSIKGN